MTGFEWLRLQGACTEGLEFAARFRGKPVRVAFEALRRAAMKERYHSRDHLSGERELFGWLMQKLGVRHRRTRREWVWAHAAKRPDMYSWSYVKPHVLANLKTETAE